MNPNFGARFVEDVTYIRYKETGKIFPFHEEFTRSVKDDLAEYVVFKQGKLNVIKEPVPLPEIMKQIMQGLQRPNAGTEDGGFTITPLGDMQGTIASLMKPVIETQAIDSKIKKVN